MRCGNIGRAGNKGFKEENCRLCGTGKENLDHAWSCEGMRSTTKEELVRKVEAEWGKVKERGRNGWIELLRGKVKTGLCQFTREFEKNIRRRAGETKGNEEEGGRRGRVCDHPGP